MFSPFDTAWLSHYDKTTHKHALDQWFLTYLGSNPKYPEWLLVTHVLIIYIWLQKNNQLHLTLTVKQLGWYSQNILV